MANLLPQNTPSAPPTGSAIANFNNALVGAPVFPTAKPAATGSSTAPVAPIAQASPAPAYQPSTATPSGLDTQIVNLAKAIRQTESQGNFQAVGKSGEYGAYQFMPSTWDATAPKYGVNVPLNQATPEQQNEVAYKQLADWKTEHPDWNVGNFASAWNAGPGKPNAYLEGNAGTNSKGVKYDTAAYASSVADNYQTFKAQTLGGTGASTDTTTGTTTQEKPTYGATFPYQEGDNGLVAGFKALGNLPSSAYGFGKSIVETVLHPIQTIENVGSAAIGGVENLTGQNKSNPDQYQQTANALGHALLQRYGGVDQLANTATNDPFGFGTDIASVLAGGAGLVGKGTELDALGSKVAGTITGPIGNSTGKLVGGVGKALSGIPAEDAIAATERTGITLPAGAYTDSPLVRQAEAFAAEGLGSSAYTARIDSAVSKMESLASKIVTDTGGATDLTTAGKTIAAGLKEYEKAFQKTNSELYSAINTEVGDVAAKTNGTTSTLNGILDTKASIGEEAGSKYFKDKLDVLNGAEGHKPPTFDTLKKMRTAVGEKIQGRFGDPEASQNIKQLTQLYRSLSEDMRATIVAQRKPSLLTKFDEANSKFKAGMDEIGMAYVKFIKKRAQNGEFSKIAEDLVKSSTPVEDIPRIMGIVGEEGAKNVRSSVLQQIIEKARNTEGEFTPKGIDRQIKNFGEDKLNAILEPGQIQDLRDLGTLTKALGDATKLTKGSQTAFLVKSLTEIGLVGSGAIDILSGNFVSGISKIAGAIGSGASSYFIASDAGQALMRRAIVDSAAVKAETAKLGLTSTEDTANVGPNGDTNGTGAGVSNIEPASDTSGTVSEKAKAALLSSAALEELAKKSNFDIEAARSAGYSDEEILGFLTSPTSSQ